MKPLSSKAVINLCMPDLDFNPKANYFSKEGETLFFFKDSFKNVILIV